MILVTAFKPFGDLKENSSFEALSHASLPSGTERAYLDCDCEKVEGELKILLDRYHPEMIIMFGQSGLNKEIMIERRAHNLADFRIADTGGHQLKKEKIQNDGPEYRFSTLDVVHLKNYLKAGGIEALISDDAGHFLCNYAYYLALGTKIPTIFLHLPLFIGQSDDPKYHYRDYLTIVKAVELTVRSLEEAKK